MIGVRFPPPCCGVLLLYRSGPRDLFIVSLYLGVRKQCKCYRTTELELTTSILIAKKNFFHHLFITSFSILLLRIILTVNNADMLSNGLKSHFWGP